MLRESSADKACDTARKLLHQEIDKQAHLGREVALLRIDHPDPHFGRLEFIQHR